MIRDRISDYLSEAIQEAYKHRSLSTVYYMKLEGGLSIVLAWEKGFATEDEHELCYSLRKTDSSYFVDDWDMIDEDCSIDRENIKPDEYAGYLMDMIKSYQIAAT